MTFKLPKNLSEVELDELDTLTGEAQAEIDALLAKDDADLTDEDIERLDELAGANDAIAGEKGLRETAAAERSAKIAAARERAKPVEDETPVDETPAEEVVEEVAEPVAAGAETEELAVETPEVEEVVAEEPEAIVASAAERKAQALARAAKNAPVAKAPVQEEKPMYSLIAAGDVPGISAGSKFENFDQVVSAFGEKLDAFVVGSGSQSITNRYPIANMGRETDPLLTITADMNKDQAAEVLRYATSESRLEKGSLVASGGWAAPSQIIYDIPIVEQAPDGILSLPEITVQRGGFQHTLGIDFATAIYNNANFGFTQTETQAAAKTVKPFIEPTDPTFIDERLQVLGYGMRAGFLTLQGYPELIKRMASGSVTAFAHYKNRDRINRLLAYFNAPIVGLPTIGSLTHQILDTLAFQRRRLIHKNFLAQNASFQAMAPFWLLDVIREDLAKRQGWDAIKVTDAYINGLFADHNISVQWTRDWTAQDLSGTATAWPNTVEIALWYAGTFVAASGNVVSFDAVYDYDGISKNTYTAFFNEESVLVARMLPIDALRLTFDTTVLNREGRTGKDDLGFTRA